MDEKDLIKDTNDVDMTNVVKDISGANSNNDFANVKTDVNNNQYTNNNTNTNYNPYTNNYYPQQNMYENTNVLSTKDWLKYLLLMCIPFAGIVFLIIWAIGDKNTNQNLSNFARGYLIAMAIVFAIVMLLDCGIWFIVIYLLSMSF